MTYLLKASLVEEMVRMVRMVICLQEDMEVVGPHLIAIQGRSGIKVQQVSPPDKNNSETTT